VPRFLVIPNACRLGTSSRDEQMIATAATLIIDNVILIWRLYKSIFLSLILQNRERFDSDIQNFGPVPPC
jgi:uncharacterized membrane protein YqjE